MSQKLCDDLEEVVQSIVNVTHVMDDYSFDTDFHTASRSMDITLSFRGDQYTMSFLLIGSRWGLTNFSFLTVEAIFRRPTCLHTYQVFLRILELVLSALKEKNLS